MHNEHHVFIFFSLFQDLWMEGDIILYNINIFHGSVLFPIKHKMAELKTIKNIVKVFKKKLIIVFCLQIAK